MRIVAVYAYYVDITQFPFSNGTHLDDKWARYVVAISYTDNLI